MAPHTAEQHKLLAVRHLIAVSIVKMQKSFDIINYFIALCYLVQWPAYFWLLDSALILHRKTAELPTEIKIVCPFVVFGFFVSFLRFFTAFLPVCIFFTLVSHIKLIYA